MKLRELLSLIFQNLNRRKGRVFLTAIGVVIGTAAVVILVSLAQGLRQNASEQFGNIAQMSQISVMPDWESVSMQVQEIQPGMAGYEMPQPAPITPEAIEGFRTIPGVGAVIPRAWLQASAMMKLGKLETWASIIGLGTDDMAVLGYEMASGISTLSKGSVIVGQEVARNFYDPSMRPGQDPPPPPDLQGQVIQLILTKWVEDSSGNMIETRKVLRLEVAGVIQSSRDEADYSVYMPLEQVLEINAWVNGRRFDPKRDGYEMAVVIVDDRERVLDIAAQINEMGYMAYTPQEFIQGVNSFFIILQVIFGGVGGVALLVAAIGIANTMTMAILERTREIGLMKAVGATNQDVLSLFLGEAAGIGFIGGIGGVLLGLLLGELINVFGNIYMAGQSSGMYGGMGSGLSVSTPVWLVLFALLFSTVIGLISGLYPAVRAASLVPVQALKYE
jgi:putative ABC transport system permease protein